jgi:ethanolamine utilization protein EutN
MIIARIIGTVVASQKDARLEGKKLLIVRPVNLDGTDTSGYVVAVDTVGAGFHERVLVVAGSSARLAQNMKDAPVDAAIVGVIDTVDIHVAEAWQATEKSDSRSPRSQLTVHE